MAKPKSEPIHSPIDLWEFFSAHGFKALDERWNTLQKEGASPDKEVEEAFFALGMVHGMAELGGDDSSLPSVIPIPSWAVGVLVERWRRYLDFDIERTLGEAFDIEGGGQGKSPAKRRWMLDGRNFHLAWEVWDYLKTERAKGRKPSIKDEAIPKIAQRHKDQGIKEGTVKHAWSKWRNLIKRCDFSQN